MNKSTMFHNLIQNVVTEEEVRQLISQVGYEDTARKCTVYQLFLFFVQAAFSQWKSYRDGAPQTSLCGLPEMDYSTLSKKAKSVPFEIYKQLFHHLVQKCSRHVRRKLNFPKELLITDSTKITVGIGRLPWAPLKGSRAGVKLNVAYRPLTGQPHHVVESTGLHHDICSSDELFDSAFINVADRAYAKCKRFDKYVEQKRDFVIRLKDEVVLHKPRPSRRQRPEGSLIEQDVTCQLGTGVNRSRLRHRVVKFSDPSGKPVVLATSLKRISAEKIAEIYKLRWQIEVFFRWIKQHLNVPALFGTTPNAVFSQLYIALLVYVVLKSVYDETRPKVSVFNDLTFVNFARLLHLQLLPVEWVILLYQYRFPDTG